MTHIVWTRIMAEASEAGLICYAYGGVATLMVPEEQRPAGIRERVLGGTARASGSRPGR